MISQNKIPQSPRFVPHYCRGMCIFVYPSQPASAGETKCVPMKLDKPIAYVCLGLAVALLLCLLPMPYGYYTLIRMVAMVIFAFLALIFFKRSKTVLGLVAVVLVLLFQPFAKEALGRDLWQVVDVVAAIALTILSWPSLKDLMQQGRSKIKQ